MKLTIYHTNDMHSFFPQLAKAAAYLRANRQPEDLYFDCGDLCDLRDVTVQGSGGLGAVRLLRSMGCDAMAVGNNELDLEHDALAALSGAMPLLSVNVRDNDGDPVGQLLPSRILQRAGLRILLLGVSPYFSAEGEPEAYNTFFRMGNLMTVDPYPLLRSELDRHAGQYDLCILLSHSGAEIERRILARFPEIDLCLGGHCHRRMTEDRYHQAGKHGKWLGKVELEIESRQVIAMKTEEIPLEGEEDPAFLALWKQEEKAACAALGKPLYEIPPLPWSLTEESPLTNFIADALYAEYPCELALVNAGIVEGELGTVISRALLIEKSPSKLNPTRYRITGRQLRQAVEASLDTAFCRQAAPGSGARWSALGTLGFSHNLRICRQSLAITISGQPLDEDRVYTVMSHDALQRGTGYGMLRAPEEEFYRGFIRDLLERTLQQQALHETAKIRRIR